MLKVIDNMAVWVGDYAESDTDVWFIPAFGESHLCFRDAHKHKI